MIFATSHHTTETLSICTGGMHEHYKKHEIIYRNSQKEQTTRHELYELRWDACWNATNERESAKGLII